MSFWETYIFKRPRKGIGGIFRAKLQPFMYKRRGGKAAALEVGLV
jgi:hypothetical protein